MPRAATSATVQSSIGKTGRVKTGRAAKIVASAASSRVAIGPSSRVKTVRFPIVRRATARSAPSSPVATAHFRIAPRAMARSGRSSRAVIARPMGVMTVRRAGIATIPVRPAEPATRSLATSDLTRRAAIVRNASSTASGSFRAAHRTAIAASAAIRNPGRSAMRLRAATGRRARTSARVRARILAAATAVRTSLGRSATIGKAAATTVRAFRARATIVHRVIVRSASGPNSTVPSSIVRARIVPSSIVRARIVPGSIAAAIARNSIVPRERSEGRSDWHEHPRSEARTGDRPRRENEDESRIFEKRPAFGGRGAYRDRDRDSERRPRREEEVKPKKAGERIAKVLSRAGLASRRDAEEMVTQGRVSVNGRVINSPALDITSNDVVTVDGKPLPERERTRLFLYHKPRGLMTTHDDPEGRPTVFDNLPEGLPRLISVGRLDFNTEGLLLLTNDGGLARTLELPDTGWLRRYRVRAHGDVTQAQLDELKNGIEIEGVKYGPIDATLERDQGANVWLVFAIREGKNREVRNVCAHLGLEVNRLIRVSYGPFQLGEVPEGQVEEIKSRVLRDQLGEKIIEKSGAQFDVPQKLASHEGDDAPREKKPASKRGVINDRKGRRVLVQRTGSEEARERNEAEASGYGPPRRPKRGYHGKRDLAPKED
ncbi:pseudouridine synthase [Bradyrhizobium sp. F1.13.1]